MIVFQGGDDMYKIPRGSNSNDLFEFEPRDTQDLRRRTGIIPVNKDSHTRIKPLALASGNGRCMTVTPKRTLVSVG